jgi:hypothetical protein
MINPMIMKELNQILKQHGWDRSMWPQGASDRWLFIEGKLTDSERMSLMDLMIGEELGSMEIPPPRRGYEADIYRACLNEDQWDEKDSFSVFLAKCFSQVGLPSPIACSVVILLFGFVMGWFLNPPAKVDSSVFVTRYFYGYGDNL